MENLANTQETAAQPAASAGTSDKMQWWKTDYSQLQEEAGGINNQPKQR
ncbi:MAG: hypothetical protein GXZ09_03195 [Syntrophomonadaceae bacterium]|nr:hypothetical protein [Syntrophomonadaceae bacterium]